MLGLYRVHVMLPFITAIIIFFSMIYYWYNRRHTAKFYSFLCFSFLCAIWSMGQALERLTDDINISWLLTKVQYFGIVFITLNGLIFILFYTDNPIVKSKKVIAGLIIPPLIFYIFILTNEYHNLFYLKYSQKEIIYGPVFYFHTFYSYSLYFVALIVLLKYSFKNTGNIRKQSIMIILSLSVPLFTNLAGLVYTYLGNFEYPNRDYTPTSFLVFILFVLIATFKYKFLNITPVAQKLIFENMKESIVVLDNLNRVVRYNKSFKVNLAKYAKLRFNNDISLFTAGIKKYVIDDHDNNSVFTYLSDSNVFDVSGEFIIKTAEVRCFSVNIKPIIVKESEIYGRIISFNDISEYKKLLTSLNDKNIELHEKNTELSVMYEKLKEHNAALEELTIQRERNRFTMDVHDTLGHTMTILQKQLEIINIAYKKDTELTKKTIEESMKVVTEGLTDLKRSIIGLRPERLKSESLIICLEELIAIFDTSNIDIELTVEGRETFSSLLISEAVFRVCQEALTNSIRHGKAKKILILIRFLEDKLKIYIIDDGIGCKNVEKGFGLTGMEKRVRNLNGIISYGSGGESGFNIYVEIPYGSVVQNDKSSNSG